MASAHGRSTVLGFLHGNCGSGLKMLVHGPFCQPRHVLPGEHWGQHVQTSADERASPVCVASPRIVNPQQGSPFATRVTEQLKCWPYYDAQNWNMFEMSSVCLGSLGARILGQNWFQPSPGSFFPKNPKVFTPWFEHICPLPFSAQKLVRLDENRFTSSVPRVR